ncbi:MAG: cytochrome d ubiquinol oxidase subunit II [Bacilli bacterium]
MSHEMISEVWFVLWTVLWLMYFVTDAFALGTGMLFPYLAKDRKERNQLQESIGPFWNGNEVWLVTAAGGTFAAFPLTYANMFSYLYVPFFLLLFAIFFRAVCLEFMHKDDHPTWQNACKWIHSISSYIIAFLLGVAFTNFFFGLEIGPEGYEGTTLGLFNRAGLIGGTFFVTAFITSGALWTMLKVSGPVAERAYKAARSFSVAASITLSMLFIILMNRSTTFDNYNDMPVLYALPTLAMVLSVVTIFLIFKKKIGFAFTTLCLTITTGVATGFVGMFPFMLPSRIKAEYGTDLYEAAASHNTLNLMFWVAIIMVPIVISYQLWAYKLFSKKIEKETAQGYK